LTITVVNIPQVNESIRTTTIDEPTGKYPRLRSPAVHAEDDSDSLLDQTRSLDEDEKTKNKEKEPVAVLTGQNKTVNGNHGIFALAMMALTSVRSRWSRWRHSEAGYHSRGIYFDTEWDEYGKDITNTHMFNGSWVETYTETYDTIYRPYHYENAKRHSLTYQHSAPVKRLMRHPGWAEDIAYHTALDLLDEIWGEDSSTPLPPRKRRWNRVRTEEDTSAPMEICEQSAEFLEYAADPEHYQFEPLTEESVSNLGNLESLGICSHPVRLMQSLPVIAPGTAPWQIIAWLQDTGASFDLAS
jgi:hypothetical protein